jgi:hypothetical protein
LENIEGSNDIRLLRLLAILQVWALDYVPIWMAKVHTIEETKGTRKNGAQAKMGVKQSLLRGRLNRRLVVETAVRFPIVSGSILIGLI